MFRTAAYTTLALVAFAANSVLCRLALGEAAIDPATFTSVRVVSGAAMLLLISARPGSPGSHGRHGDWASAVLLSLYAVPFAFAYVSLPTGTGALILFGCVQSTMMLTALLSGERPSAPEWTGLIAALGGITYLVSPGVASPDPAGSLLMAAAGTAWGFYSLRGRGTDEPVRATTGNFTRAVPLVVLASLMFGDRVVVSPAGLALAAVSGAITSGLGYVIWYRALRDLTATRAAIVQLPVPLITALGGVVILSETVSLRLVISGVLILGGVALALTGRARVRHVPHSQPGATAAALTSRDPDPEPRTPTA